MKLIKMILYLTNKGKENLPLMNTKIHDLFLINTKSHFSFSISTKILFFFVLILNVIFPSYEITNTHIYFLSYFSSLIFAHLFLKTEFVFSRKFKSIHAHPGCAKYENFHADLFSRSPRMHFNL